MGNNDVNWHLKKELSLGHLISTILLIIMMIGGYIDIQKRLATLETHVESPSHSVSADKRVDNLEARMSRVEAVDSAMAVRLEDLHQEILRRLDRQDVKLDRIEDRLNGGDP